MPVALVTGAGSGIGLATVLRLLDEGYKVVGVDLQAPQIDAEPDSFVGIPADVTEQADNERAVSEAVNRFGSLDAVALNAGVTGSGAIDALPIETYERILAVDLTGPVLGMRAAIGALRASRGPRSVVVTASTSGLGGDPGMWAYNAAKAGAVNLVRSLALELGAEGIRVNAVCPGPTVTAMTSRLRDTAPEAAGRLIAAIPLHRWGQPEEIAEAIAFLLSPKASFISGVALPVDGGVTATTGQFLPSSSPA